MYLMVHTVAPWPIVWDRNEESRNEKKVYGSIYNFICGFKFK